MKKSNKSTEYQKLHSFAALWVKTQMRPFTSEDLRQAYITAGNALLDNLNCFGLVIRSLHNDKAISKADSTAKATMPNAHSRLLHVWISAEYSLSQASKRQLPKTEQMSLM